MAITEHTPQTALSVDNTELSLISGTSTLQANATAGVYQLFVDGVANMVKGDEFVIRAYETVRSGGTKRKVFSLVIADAQSEIMVLPPMTFLWGWDFTMQRTAGSARAFDTSIRKVG
jgi:hypothetical protein